MSLTVGIATAILPNRPSDAEQGDTGNSKGVELGETLARHMFMCLNLHMFTCLNYTCNSEIRAYEFINSMNSYTTEFRGFMNSYTYEFISI